MALMSAHVAVKDLAPSIQQALRAVEYGAHDIAIEPAESVSPQAGYGAGQKGFVVLVDLNTGGHETHYGSWGGANMFNPSNPVDLDTHEYAIPSHGCVIKGEIGYPRTFATVYVNPSQLASFLPAHVETSLEDQNALYCFAAIKGGEYRREELQRKNVSAATVDSLITRGLLARNKAGAMSITLAGKNARDGRVRY